MRNRNQNLLRLFLWALALGWGAVLFVFSGQNGVQSGNLSRMFTQWLLRLVPSLPWSAAQMEPVLRKIAHFGIFALEGCLLGTAMLCSLRSRSAAVLISASVCAAVAGLNEFHQSFVAGRNAAFTDVLIDTGGALTGILFALLMACLARRIASRRRARRRNVII